ncbi:GntR family transcriptional regulator [Tessaracoccus sp. SD287]|uniref:GntR family transcriptional regulator n=1 Tax=Tessaracoccus sp. SD287 TaxID=2782008 RepID=UPI001A95EBE3|nr:GntR family transcriptional regulator [Tessaracoccus sp. SD287]MBO1030937.1 GntR family transcriptional regulator [Tessaracoccus sp. SD287]
MYRAIARDLWSRIGEQRLPPGNPLPSESELTEQYQVNRLTLRQALEELRRAGAIEVRHGRGAFVAEAPTLVEFATRVQPHGRDSHWTSPGDAGDDDGATRPSLRQVSEQLLSPSPGRQDYLEEGADHIGLPAAQVRAHHTLMLDSGHPWIANTYVVPASLTGLVGAFTGTGLMRRALQKLSDQPLVHHWRAFSAMACSMDDADALSLEVGSPLLVREGVMGTRDQPMVYVVRRMPGRSARFVLHYLDPTDDDEQP